MVELLCVTAILLILATLYWGSTGTSRARQRQAACREHMARVFMALTIYANSQGGQFPNLPGATKASQPLSLLVPKFTVETDNFLCPAAGGAPLAAGLPLTGQRIGYAFYMGRRASDGNELLLTDAQTDDRPKLAGQPLFSTTGATPGNNHGKEGGNLLFGDGRAEWSAGPAPRDTTCPAGVALVNP